MANYSEEQREIHRGMVKRAIALDPTVSFRKLQGYLAEKEKLEISLEYIQDIVKDVRKLWIEQYDHETKDLLAARFEEVCMYLIDNFRQIIKEEKLLYNNKDGSVKASIISQKNRIIALKEIRETVKAMMEMKMDLGIIDRHLGRIGIDADITKVRNVVADLIAYEKQQHGIAIAPDVGAVKEN